MWEHACWLEFPGKPPIANASGHRNGVDGQLPPACSSLISGSKRRGRQYQKLPLVAYFLIGQKVFESDTPSKRRLVLWGVGTKLAVFL